MGRRAARIVAPTITGNTSATKVERAELSKEEGPSLLNIVSLDNNMYAAQDKCEGVVFSLSVMVQRHMMNPHYLYFGSCSVFNQAFIEDQILDFKTTRIYLRAGCNAGTSTPDEQGLVLGAIKAWLVRTGITNVGSLPQLENTKDGCLLTRPKMTG